jgi:hypothetical protein
MSPNVIPSTPVITPNLQDQTGTVPTARAKKQAAQQPRLKAHESKSHAELGAGANQTSLIDPLKQHSAPRAQVRVDQKAVDQVLLEGKIPLEEISVDKHAAYYKHASMMITGSASDKSYLLRCLAALYISVPDETHPYASGADWLDDQNELWGDDLMFLFENTQQVDELNSAGKQYFLDALLEKANLRYRDKGSEGDLSQALFQAKHRMPVMEDHSA